MRLSSPKAVTPVVVPALVLILGTLLPQEAASMQAATPPKTFTVVEGAVQVSGGESACFRLADTSMTSDRLLVHVRFQGKVPKGHVSLDGTPSESFQENAEEFSFVVDPRGTHRVRLELQEKATVDRLNVSSTDTSLLEASCSTYEENRRDVDLPAAPPPTTNRLGAPERPAPEAPPAPARTAPAPQPAASSTIPGGTVSAGSTLELTLQNTIDTHSAYAGQAFHSRLDRDVAGTDGRVLLPAGTTVEGHVAESQDAGRFGHSTLKLTFDTARLADGTAVPVVGTLQHVGKGSAKKQGAIIAGSVIGGAILGHAIGGNSTGTAAGALLGGAISAGSIAAKPGESIVLPAGTAIEITLDAPAEVPPRGGR